MANPIVVVNVSVQSNPAPNTLLQTGAFISCGGTNLTPGTYARLSLPSTLATILTPAAAITSLAWSGSVVTVTTAAAHGIPSGATVEVTIAGAVPTGYNGTFAATYTGASTFTYPLAVNPGAETTPGTWQPTSAVELVAMNDTFWAQGAGVSPYVLELGLVTVDNAVTALGTFISATSPQFFSHYLPPREWTGDSAFQAFVATFDAPANLTWFHVPVTSANYTTWVTAADKAAVCTAEPPGIPATEYPAAARFALELGTAPSSVSPVAPMSFRYVYGVTPYPANGNSTLLAAFGAGNVDYFGTASEGGISNTIIFGGNYMDGKPFTFWYATAWLVVNFNLDLSNAVINGSNSSFNPLYFDQTGINRLKAVAQQTINNGGTYGMLEPGGTLTAVSFVDYVKQQPALYAEGVYNGFSATQYPRRGFTEIVFNLTVSDLA